MVLKEPPEPPSASETPIEIRRGVSRISVEPGYSVVHVSQMPDADREHDRLAVLRHFAQGFIGVRFPKFTPSGASFLLAEGDAARATGCLERTGFHFSVRDARSVVSIHAPSIREEPGLIARLVARLMASNVAIEHVSDAHDRLMAVVRTADADRLADGLASLVRTPYRPAIPRTRADGRVKVLKFGGTSVETQEARARATLKVREAVDAGYRPVVVVSAIGRRGLPYATDTLIEHLRLAAPGQEPNPRDLDLMLSCGEILSAVIFVQALGAAGIRAHAFRGDQAGILTDEAFGQARIVGVDPSRLEESLGEGFVPVVCGFQGCVAPSEGRFCGEVTTLGRGGSDTSAAALGAALGAEAVEIYTDVDGILSADPRLVPLAKPLWESDYDEVATLAHLGAKVVHPRAVEIAKSHRIPLWIKNTFSEEHGTEIAPIGPNARPHRTGVSMIEGLVHVRFDLRGVEVAERTCAERRIFDFFAEHDVPLMMVDLSPTSSGLAFPKAAYAGVQSRLGSLGLPFTIGEACTLVSIVGSDYTRTPGTLHLILSALRRAGIHTLQINAVDPAISLLVSASDGRAAVAILFDYHHTMEED